MDDGYVLEYVYLLLPTVVVGRLVGEALESELPLLEPEKKTQE